MTPTEIDTVRGKIENEGFDYCFTGYSDWQDVRDEEFHRLRLAYVNARKAFADFLCVED